MHSTLQRFRLPLRFAAVLLAASGCRSPNASPDASAATSPMPSPPIPARLFPDLGRFHRPVTTKSPEAQAFFDQGLLLCFAFNHEEATRSFREAERLDPECAMAAWGTALAAGPHINNPTMDEAASRAAADSIARARRLATRALPVERELIEALSKRYAWPPPADRKPLDQAYADAMREVWKRHRDDADVGALFAESMMDLRPWALYSRDGKPAPGTDEIVATLAAVLALVPDHVGGLHYTIHTFEMSPTPEKALPAADLLRHRVPGSGHLVHMPSHIDMRVGHYAEAIAANQRAIDADLRYVQHAGRMNFMTLYRAHDYHLLQWAAMYDGQSVKAIAASRDLVREMPIELVDSMPDFLEAFLASPYHALIRFGRWDEILAEPPPPERFRAANAFWLYARTMAFSAEGRVEEAAKERALFEKSAAAVPASVMLANNSAQSVLAVARALAEGELEYRLGHHERAFALLRTAVEREDALVYDEPWGWMQPVRHALGALLLEQGRIEEAEAVYVEDLKRHPENSWALHGLAECATRRGDESASVAAQKRFDAAWSRADVRLQSSCFCRTGSP